MNLYGDGVYNIELNEFLQWRGWHSCAQSDSTTSLIYVSRGTRLGCAYQLGFDELVDVVCPSSQTISGRFEVGDSFAKSEE